MEPEISAEQGDQSGSEQADIKGKNIDLHAQEFVKKREVACSNKDGIPGFSKCAE